MSTVFWSEKEHDFTKNLAYLFQESPKDDPSRATEALRSLYNAVKRGGYTPDDGLTKFFVLGLSPNVSRISIRLWRVGKVIDFADKIKKHFDYLDIIGSRYDGTRFQPLTRLLRSIAARGEDKNIPPHLAGDVFRSILEGVSYPYSLFQAAIRRCKLEQSVNYDRASIIKACLNRYNISNQEKEEIKMSLNKNSIYQSYQLGRYFAVLEKIQKDSGGGSANSTIRDRFFGSASSNPIVVFPTLAKLSQNHLSKMRKDKGKQGWVINHDKNITEILSKLS